MNDLITIELPSLQSDKHSTDKYRGMISFKRGKTFGMGIKVVTEKDIYHNVVFRSYLIINGFEYDYGTCMSSERAYRICKDVYDTVQLAYLKLTC